MGLGVIRMEPAKRLPDGHLVDHVRGLTRPSTHHLHAHLGVGVEVLRDDPVAFDAACRRTAELAAAQRGGRAPSLSWLLAIGGVDTIDVCSWRRKSADKWWTSAGRGLGPALADVQPDGSFRVLEKGNRERSAYPPQVRPACLPTGLRSAAIPRARCFVPSPGLARCGSVPPCRHRPSSSASRSGRGKRVSPRSAPTICVVPSSPAFWLRVLIWRPPKPCADTPAPLPPPGMTAARRRPAGLRRPSSRSPCTPSPRVPPHDRGPVSAPLRSPVCPAGARARAGCDFPRCRLRHRAHVNSDRINLCVGYFRSAGIARALRLRRSVPSRA